MRLLLDTHLILWAAGVTGRVSAALRAELDEPKNTLVFSVASLWEIAIKAGRRRPDFAVDPIELRRLMRAYGWEELPVTGDHAVAVAELPPLHKDPFDRLLIAQAQAEGLTLLTSDARLARYAGPVRVV